MGDRRVRTYHRSPSGSRGGRQLTVTVAGLACWWLISCRMVIALSVRASNILGDPIDASRSLDSDKIHDCTVFEDILRDEWPLKPVGSRIA